MVNEIDRLAWVTAGEARGRDEDEPVALAALARTGVTVDVVDWDDRSVEWAAYDRVVLRSAWDYPQRLAEFLTWLDEVTQVTELVNRPALVRWSLDKRYLAELAAAGVPITPTVFVEPGSTAEFPDGDFVVKPAVGAGSRDAASYGPEDHAAASAHVARLHVGGQVVLVQPFLKSVPIDGEWPLVFFDGRFSHAASKRVDLPRAGAVDDLFAVENNAAHTADPDQIEVAQAAVDLVTGRFGTPTYARVDLVRDNDGRYCVLEVELVEPSLFLPQADPAAADRLAAALTSPTGER
ncbi:RimK family alpha-L-glutamate ligase [Nocardioides sp. NPDC057577]|uniref:ATP-grasp domain-containing protein n=1 Tax=Nocardioides sp. NPDC057577 TaxID=3346171 RepID=UPI00366E1437